MEVDYEPLPAVTDLLDAIKPDAPRLAEGGNILKHYKVRKGDVEKGFEESDVIVEQSYATPLQEPAPIGRDGMFLRSASASRWRSKDSRKHTEPILCERGCYVSSSACRPKKSTPYHPPLEGPAWGRV